MKNYNLRKWLFMFRDLDNSYSFYTTKRAYADAVKENLDLDARVFRYLQTGKGTEGIKKLFEERYHMICGR